VIKLTEIQLFREQLISSPLLSSLAGFITWALPISEILLAIALFMPIWRSKALYATCALMIMFTAYVIIILLMDNHLSCSCGGIVEELSPRQHIFFNSACVALSGIGIWLTKRHGASRRFKLVTNTLVIGLLLFLSWTVFAAFSAPPAAKTGMEGRLLPPFDLLLVDSVTHLNTKDIPTGKPFVVIGFSPFCKHCDAETENIINNIEQFKGLSIYFVTPFQFQDMKDFYRYFKLYHYSNILVGRDSSDFFMSYFKAEGTPFTAIFDSKKRLKAAFGKEVGAAKLIMTAEE